MTFGISVSLAEEMSLKPIQNFVALFRGQRQNTRSHLTVIILFKKTVCIGHRDDVLARCDSIFPLLNCQGVWNENVHTTFFPKSSFRIRRTTVLGMFKDSAIIFDAIRWLFLTKSATAAMFTAIRVDFGRPHLSLTSTCFLPSQNRECHLKTSDRFRASFP